MKFFIGITLIAVFAAGAVHAAVSELEPSKQGVQQGNAAENLESLRIRKAARAYGAPAPSYGAPAPAPGPSPSYGSAGPSIPAPPCPKNYLFSCQPHMAPVPCAAPPASGYQGSYSHQIAQWAANPQLEN